jgi:SPP1 gp7 family putative phage head morphogenesis protein
VSLTARVAAHGFAAQIETLGRADAAGDRADRHVGTVWRRLLAILDQFRGPHRAVEAYQAILDLLRPLGHELVGVIGTAATDAARESYDDAAGTLIAQLPAAMLLRTAPVTEARDPLQITFDGVRGFLPNFDGLPDDEQDELFRQMIFPAPSADRVRSVVYGNGWINRIDAMTRAAPPESVASAVMQNITAGKKINDLARELLPMFNGVRATARRVARDTSMHAAHAMQHQAWNQLGDLVLGYQVNAVLDERTRPEHRARNGQRFYKQPRPGQKGMDECPQPPFESPKNGAGLAYNCRCFLTPTLANPTDAGTELLPGAVLDRETAANWYGGTSKRNQRIAIGAERYDTATATLGRPPTWHDVTDATGQLLPVDMLRRSMAA